MQHFGSVRAWNAIDELLYMAYFGTGWHAADPPCKADFNCSVLAQEPSRFQWNLHPDRRRNMYVRGGQWHWFPLLATIVQGLVGLRSLLLPWQWGRPSIEAVSDSCSCLTNQPDLHSFEIVCPFQQWTVTFVRNVTSHIFFPERKWTPNLLNADVFLKKRLICWWTGRERAGRRIAAWS